MMLTASERQHTFKHITMVDAQEFARQALKGPPDDEA
jgi:hypothetical protein